jgi:hypothetical protein
MIRCKHLIISGTGGTKPTAPFCSSDNMEQELRVLALLGDDTKLGGDNVPSPRTIAVAVGDASLWKSDGWLLMCEAAVKAWRGDRRKLLPRGLPVAAGAVQVQKGGHVDVKRGKGGKASVMLKLKGPGAGSYRVGGSGDDLVPCSASDSRAAAVAEGERASIQFGSTTHTAALHALIACCHWWYLAAGGDEGVCERHKFTNEAM